MNIVVLIRPGTAIGSSIGGVPLSVARLAQGVGLTGTVGHLSTVTVDSTLCLKHSKIKQVGGIGHRRISVGFLIQCHPMDRMARQAGYSTDRTLRQVRAQ